MKFTRKFVAYRNGGRISDVVLSNIIYAAFRGKMTKSGRRLLLVPDRRYGPANELGHQKMRRVRRSECITLEAYIRETYETFDVTHIDGRLDFTPKRNRDLEASKSRKLSTPTLGIGTHISSPSRDTCGVCGTDLTGRRADTKFCSAKCRKRAQRSGVFK